MALTVQPLANRNNIQGAFYNVGGVPAQPYSAPAPADTSYSYDTGGSDYYGGGGGGYSYAAPAPDPYAKWGGLAGYQTAVADYGRTRDSTYGSIDNRIGNEAGNYNSSILDFLEGSRAGQAKIDGQSVQNELARQQGSAGVLDTVGRGLKSGGVMLANKNATSSSAGEALARAWGDIGRRQQSGVNNQFEQGKAAIGLSEDDLRAQMATGMRHIGESKTNVINSIVTDAQNALASLNSAAANASLPDRVDIEAKKQEIRNKALAALQQYDQSLNSGVAAIGPQDANTTRTKAAALKTAGVAATNPFNYDSTVPVQLQNTGPFASELPIFQLPAKKSEAVL